MFFKDNKAHSSEKLWATLSIPIPTQSLGHLYQGPLHDINAGFHREMNVGEERGVSELLNSRDRLKLFINGVEILPLLSHIEPYDEKDSATKKRGVINSIEDIISNYIEDENTIKLILRNINQYYFGMPETLLIPILKSENNHMASTKTERAIYFDCDKSTDYRLRIRIIAKNMQYRKPERDENEYFPLGHLGIELMERVHKKDDPAIFDVHIATHPQSKQIVYYLTGKNEIANLLDQINTIINQAKPLLSSLSQDPFQENSYQAIVATAKKHELFLMESTKKPVDNLPVQLNAIKKFIKETNEILPQALQEQKRHRL